MYTSVVGERRSREPNTKQKRDVEMVHPSHHLQGSLSLERGGVGALEGDAGVVDENVAPPVLLLHLRGEPLPTQPFQPGKKRKTNTYKNT